MVKISSIFVVLLENCFDSIVIRRGGGVLRKEPAEGGTQSIICDVAAWKIPRNKHP